MRRFQRAFRHFPSPLPLLFILTVAAGVIFYGRGYRLNLRDENPTNLKPTGLISVSSDPTAAQVFVDGILRTATKDTINIDPGWYEVKIVKEGFIPWNKRVRVQGEVVTNIDPFLFPKNPSLSPVTNLGIEQATISPDGTRIAYIIPQNNGEESNQEKAGLWVYDLSDRTFNFNRDPRQIGINSSQFNFSQVSLKWGPDSASLIASGSSVRLYSLNRNTDFVDITDRHEAVLKEWKDEEVIRKRQKLLTFKQPIIDIAEKSMEIISFSPDETKMLYQATTSATIPLAIDPPLIGTNSTEETRNIEPNKLYVYDSREDKNYFVLDTSELPSKTLVSPLPSPAKKKVEQEIAEVPPTDLAQKLRIHWFPTSRHLVLTFEGKIDIMEFDRTNWITVYSGPLVEGFMAPWPNGSRILILTNLNSDASSLPNLYTVNLR